MNHAHSPASHGPTIYTVPLTLGARELTLEFNYKGYLAMFEYTGIDLLGDWDPSTLGIKETVCLLLAACITHHPDIQFDWALEQLRGTNSVPILKALFSAYRLSMPEPEPDAPADPPQPVM